MNALDQARSLLPWWVIWGWLLIWLPALFMFFWLAAWGGSALALRPLREYSGDCWVEKARLAWPGRIVVSLSAFTLTILGGLLMLPAAQLRSEPNLAVIGPGCLAGLLASLLVGQQVRRRLGLATGSLLERLRGTLSFMLIAYPQVPVLLFLVLLMPHTWEWRAVPIMLAGVLLLTGLLLGGGLWLSRWLGAVQPASPRLTDLIARTAERVGIRPQAVWEADLGFSNAFALPLTQSVLVTRSLLEQLSDDETIAIVAHELAHLGESRAVSLVRVSAVFFMLPLGAAGLVIDAVGLIGLLALLLMMYLGVLLVMRMARRMEHEADRVGQAHEMVHGDYARALERLHQIELIPAVLAGKAQTHPHLYDRLLAAGVEPAYPRPAPPSRGREFMGFLAMLLIALVGVTTFYLGLHLGPQLVFGRSEPAVLARIALTGGDAQSLGELALLRYQGDQRDQAVILWRAAAELNPDSSNVACNLAIVLADLDRCDEAEAALQDARERVARERRAGSEAMLGIAEDAVMRCRQ